MKPTFLEKKMKWIYSVPDDGQSPYPVIYDEPHLKTLVTYMRPSDYLTWAGVTIAFPTALYAWGNYRTKF